MKKFIAVFLFQLAGLVSYGQAGVGIGVSNPDQSAVVHIQPPATPKGLLVPRLSTNDRNNIVNPAEGLLVYDTDANALFHFNTTWQPVGVPPGVIVMWSGTTPPPGWALCNGSNGTPDLRERFIVGAGGDNTLVSGTGYTVGQDGGENLTTLSVSQLPTHQHTFDVLTESAGAHSHGMTLHDDNGGDHYRIRSAGGGNPRATYRGWTESQETSGSSATSTLYGAAAYGTAHPVDGLSDPSDQGDIKPEGQHRHRVNGSTNGTNGASGSSFENRPPYYALAFIMKL